MDIAFKTSPIISDYLKLKLDSKLEKSFEECHYVRDLI